MIFFLKKPFHLFLFFLSPFLYSDQEENKKILILYSEAGGGHKATARCVEHALNQTNSFEISVTNCADVLGFEIEKKCFKKLESTYTKNLGSAKTRFLNHLLGESIITPMAKFLNSFAKLSLNLYQENHPFVQFLQEKNPKMVISTSSFLNQHIKNAIEIAKLNIPFVVVITDFDEAHSVMWTNAKQTHYIAKKGIKILNSVEKDYFHEMDGLCVHEKFKPLQVPKSSLKKALNLNQDKKTLLVSFGGYGCDEMIEIEQITRKLKNIEGVFVCGMNKKLYEKMTQIKGASSRVLGFTNNLSDYMHAADLFIGKPGPGSVFEALYSLVPVYLRGGFNVLKQEKGVLKWVTINGFGSSFKSIEDFESHIEEILEKGSKFQQNIKNHRLEFATDQALEIILKIYQEHQNLKKKS